MRRFRALVLIGFGKGLANRVEQSGVGGGIRTPGAFDRCLVDRHHAVDGGEVAVDEARLAGSGDSSDDAENSQGNIDVDVAKIVRAGTANLDSSRGGAVAVLDPHSVHQVASGRSVGAAQLLDRPLETDPASSGSCSRPHVHHMVAD